jgi:magnesium transporter
MLLLRIVSRFLQYLRQINKIQDLMERQLQRSMKNKELIQMLGIEKSLVYFSTALKANEIVIEKILRGRVLKLYDEDQDILEDVLVENKQAIDMTNTYSVILSSTMDIFASIISNNLNIVMKKLTSITLLMAIPTMVSSFYGMNVGLPFANFGFAASLSITLTSIAYFVLWKMDMLK